MLSALKLPSIEVKTEEDEVEEEEAKGLLIRMIEPIMNIQITHSTLTTLKVRGGEARDGPISPIFSVTTARSMATMNENVEKGKMISTVTRTIAEAMFLKKKKAHQRWCLCLIKQLKNIAAQIYCY